MKKFRALTASILASAMAMSMTAGFAALAAEGDAATGTTYKVTVTNKETDKAAHTYEAYQIFEGTMETVGDDEKLEITAWGDGIDLDKLGEALKKLSDFADIKVENNAASAQDVANVLNKYADDDDNIQAFAKAVGDALVEANAIKKSAAAGGVTDVEVSLKGAGYYLIKDINGSPEASMTVNQEKDPQKFRAGETRYILTSTDVVKRKAKADYPTISKNILENEKPVSANTASIGDVVTYQLKSRVPDMDGYNKYYYIVNDSLFEGLTLKEDSFKITIDGVTDDLKMVEPPSAARTEEVGQTFYVKTGTTTRGEAKEKYTTIEIVFEDFLQYQPQKGKDITITYQATLNENAKVGSEGNPNYVDLTFSNNPNYDYDGNTVPNTPTPYEPNKPGDPNDPDNPNDNPGDPMGKTPEDKVITYTAGIQLTKVDANNVDKPLAGAEFKIVGTNLKEILVRDVEMYVEDEKGTYYKLPDDTYTETVPDGYDGTMYKKITKTVAASKDAEGNMVVENLAVDEKGFLKIYGLNVGTYYITETKAPKGYILKEDAKEITIVANPSIDNCVWTYSGTGITDATTDEQKAEGIFEFKITNPKGVVLPGTGAFGSKLMYALGTIFTGAGAAYMISKKKSKKEEE